ncbi:MAG: hypothetical protein HQK52_14825 [Oligoflexia bacterium]|nr:hypothetical protein [Oligoflexia bacterium]
MWKRKLTFRCSFLDLFACCLIITAVLFAHRWALTPANIINLNNDFLLNATYAETLRLALLKEHTFPLWSHLLGGGSSMIGHPLGFELSPLAPLVLFLGSITAMKIIPLLYFVIAGVSTYFLARRCLHYHFYGALFSALLVAVNVFMARAVESGNINEIYVCLIPLGLYLLWQGYKSNHYWRYVLFLSFTLYSSGICLLMLFPFLCAVAITEALSPYPLLTKERKERWLPLKMLLTSFALMVIIGAPFFIPYNELLLLKGGVANLQTAGHSNIYIPKITIEAPSLQTLLFIVPFMTENNSLYLGGFPVLFFCLSVALCFKRLFNFIVIFFFTLWAMIAYNAPIDLLQFLWNFPGFNYINRPEKYLGMQFLFLIILISGSYFTMIKQHFPRGIHLFAPLVILVTMSLVYLLVELRQLNTYNYKIPELGPVNQDFFQIKAWNMPRSRTAPLNALAYFNLRKNIGTIDWSTGLFLGGFAKPKFFVTKEGKYLVNQEYKGEIYPDCQHSSGFIGKMTPSFNRIDLSFILTSPCRVVLNQNYNKNWTTAIGKIENAQGVLALKIDHPGEYKFTLKFIPKSFYLGIAISLLFIMFVLAREVFYSRLGKNLRSFTRLDYFF